MAWSRIIRPFRKGKVILLYATLLLLTVAIYLRRRRLSSIDSSSSSSSSSSLSHRGHSHTTRNVLPIQYHFDESMSALPEANTTLGFEKIFAINLPSRPDRRDQLALMASMSGIDLTYSDGIQYTHRNQTSKGLPPHTKNMPLGKLGCYRAHANVWRRVIEEGIRTALILEDDVDWDVDLKHSIARLYPPLDLLQSMLADIQEEESVAAWDILRLGTCLDPAHTINSHAKGVNLTSPPYVLYEDPNSTPREHTTWEHSETFDVYGIPMHVANQTQGTPPHRIVQQSNYPVCLHAYAISNRGAAKLLYLTGQGFIDDANDLTIARLTQRGHLNSFTIIPSLFGQWKVQGWHGNSDIKREEMILTSEEKDMLTQGSSWDVKHSVRYEVRRDLEIGND